MAAAEQAASSRRLGMPVGKAADHIFAPDRAPLRASCPERLSVERARGRASSSSSRTPGGPRRAPRCELPDHGTPIASRPIATAPGACGANGSGHRRCRAAPRSGPSNAGSRFSTNAATPSWKSRVRARSCWSSASRSSCPSRSRVEHAVERLLRARVGAGGAARPAWSTSAFASSHQLVVGMHVVHEPPLERPLRGHALAQQRHLEGARLAHGGGHEQGRAAVRHQADVHEREAEVADSAASTRSHASASEAPMPTAGPFTAATTGLSSWRTPAMIGW